MANQGGFSFLNPAKGGPGKTLREYSLEDAIVEMAEAHARVARKAVQSRGNSEALLNESVTAAVDQALAILLPNVAAGRTPLSGEVG